MTKKAIMVTPLWARNRRHVNGHQSNCRQNRGSRRSYSQTSPTSIYAVLDRFMSPRFPQTAHRRESAITVLPYTYAHRTRPQTGHSLRRGADPRFLICGIPFDEALLQQLDEIDDRLAGDNWPTRRSSLTSCAQRPAAGNIQLIIAENRMTAWS